MRPSDSARSLAVALVLNLTLAVAAQAGGKGEIIENLILQGLMRGAVTGTKELMQKDGSSAPSQLPQFPHQNSTTPFPEPCSSNSIKTPECGSTDDLLNALKTAGSKKEEEQKKADPLIEICDPSSSNNDALKCLQERQLKEQLEAVKGVPANGQN